MIYKRCARCGKRIPSGSTCECYKKALKDRVHAKAKGIKKEYHTQRWKDLRSAVMSEYSGIDVYTLYKHGRVVPADTMHHIEPTNWRPELFYAYDNLLPVSRKGHIEIHERYKKENVNEVKEELREYQKRFRETGGV